jgi:hypothetical protein
VPATKELICRNTEHLCPVGLIGLLDVGIDAVQAVSFKLILREIPYLYALMSGGLAQGVFWHLLGGVAFPTELNQAYEVEFTTAGNALTVTVDGVAALTAIDNDDAYTAGRGVGLFSYQTDVYFDNWRVLESKRGR